MALNVNKKMSAMQFYINFKETYIFLVGYLPINLYCLHLFWYYVWCYEIYTHHLI